MRDRQKKGRRQQREFEQWIADRLKDAAEDIQPRDILPGIWAAIQEVEGHEVGKYIVHILKEDRDPRTPQSFNIVTIDVVLMASDEEQAEREGEQIIDIIQKDRGVEFGLVIDNLHELG